MAQVSGGLTVAFGWWPPLSLGFLICQMDVMTLPTSSGSCEGSMTTSGSSVQKDVGLKAGFGPAVSTRTPRPQEHSALQGPPAAGGLPSQAWGLTGVGAGRGL